jgi:hypothetical protein
MSHALMEIITTHTKAIILRITSVLIQPIAGVQEAAHLMQTLLAEMPIQDAPSQPISIPSLTEGKDFLADTMISVRPTMTMTCMFT